MRSLLQKNYKRDMDSLKQKFADKAGPAFAEVKALIKEKGSLIIGEYTVAQVYQGMKGVLGMVTETSKLDTQEGIRFRGYTIPELQKTLPKAPGGIEPLPEGIFHLMLIGELPSEEDVKHISNEWATRAIVPKHVFDVLDHSLSGKSSKKNRFSVLTFAVRIIHCLWMDIPPRDG